MVNALMKPANSINSVTTKISMPTTAFGPTGWRRGVTRLGNGRTFSLIRRNSPACSSSAFEPPDSVFGVFSFMVTFAVLAMFTVLSVLFECTRDFGLSGHVLPVAAMMLHDVWCNTRVEQQHEHDGRREQIADVLFLDVQMHEVRAHQV